MHWDFEIVFEATLGSEERELTYSRRHEKTEEVSASEHKEMMVKNYHDRLPIAVNGSAISN